MDARWEFLGFGLWDFLGLWDLVFGFLLERPCLVKFSVLMNVHSMDDGALIRQDLPLPELPVGADDEGVFAIDYATRSNRCSFDRAVAFSGALIQRRAG